MVAAAEGKSLCVCFVYSVLNFFFVIRKVLSQQFLIDQHVEIVGFFFHIAGFRKSLLNQAAYICSVLLSASPNQLSDCKVLLDG